MQVIGKTAKIRKYIRVKIGQCYGSIRRLIVFFFKSYFNIQAVTELIVSIDITKRMEFVCFQDAIVCAGISGMVRLFTNLKHF